MVKAKFVCIGSNKKKAWHGCEVPFMWDFEFSAVTANDSEENRSFYVATPAGTIHLVGIKEDLFEVGKEYYIDFTKAN